MLNPTIYFRKIEEKILIKFEYPPQMRVVGRPCLPKRADRFVPIRRRPLPFATREAQASTHGTPHGRQRVSRAPWRRQGKDRRKGVRCLPRAATSQLPPLPWPRASSALAGSMAGGPALRCLLVWLEESQWRAAPGAAEHGCTSGINQRRAQVGPEAPSRGSAGGVDGIYNYLLLLPMSPLQSPTLDLELHMCHIRCKMLTFLPLLPSCQSTSARQRGKHTGKDQIAHELLLLLLLYSH
jgi:hypothetical protein